MEATEELITQDIQLLVISYSILLTESEHLKSVAWGLLQVCHRWTDWTISAVRERTSRLLPDINQYSAQHNVKFDNSPIPICLSTTIFKYTEELFKLGCFSRVFRFMCRENLTVYDRLFGLSNITNLDLYGLVKIPMLKNFPCLKILRIQYPTKCEDVVFDCCPTTITNLSLCDCNEISDAIFSCGVFSNVTTLCCRDNKLITNDIFKHMPSITDLDIIGSPNFTDEIFKHIINLQCLVIGSRCIISDLPFLNGGLSSLESLMLYPNGKITNKIFRPGNFPNLTKYCTAGSQNYISMDGLFTRDVFPKLNSLILATTNSFSDATFGDIYLQKIQISGSSPITDGAFLAGYFTSLTELDLSSNYSISDDALTADTLPLLKKLNVGNTITNSPFSANHFTSLEELEIWDGCVVTNEIFTAESFPVLEKITLCGYNVSDEVLKKLPRLKTIC